MMQYWNFNFSICYQTDSSHIIATLFSTNNGFYADRDIFANASDVDDTSDVDLMYHIYYQVLEK